MALIDRIIALGASSAEAEAAYLAAAAATASEAAEAAFRILRDAEGMSFSEAAAASDIIAEEIETEFPEISNLRAARAALDAIDDVDDDAAALVRRWDVKAAIDRVNWARAARDFYADPGRVPWDHASGPFG